MDERKAWDTCPIDRLKMGEKWARIYLSHRLYMGEKASKNPSPEGSKNQS